MNYVKSHTLIYVADEMADVKQEEPLMWFICNLYPLDLYK